MHRDEILKLTGEIDDEKLAAIETAAPTPEELEEAVAWARGQSDVMGHERHSLSGRVGVIYEILTADETYDGESA